MHGDPILWLITQTHFQHIAGDGAPPLVQRRRPQEHQGAVSHFPELQVEGTTWAGKQTSEEAVSVVRSRWPNKTRIKNSNTYNKVMYPCSKWLSQGKQSRALNYQQTTI